MAFPRRSIWPGGTGGADSLHSEAPHLDHWEDTMRGLSLVPALAVAFACADFTPVEPVSDVAAPEVESISAAASHSMVPYKASGTAVTVSSSADCEGDPTNSAVVAAGGGNATHLGQVTWTYVNCLTSTFEFVSQYGIMTAANGDQVFWHGSVAAGSALTLDYANLTYTGTNFFFTGGTGRFDGVSGGFSTRGTFTADLSAITVQASGVISAVGSIGH